MNLDFCVERVNVRTKEEQSGRVELRLEGCLGNDLARVAGSRGALDFIHPRKVRHTQFNMIDTRCAMLSLNTPAWNKGRVDECNTE